MWRYYAQILIKYSVQILKLFSNLKLYRSNKFDKISNFKTHFANSNNVKIQLF